MIDFTDEKYTVHALIYVLKTLDGIPRWGNYAYCKNMSDPISALYETFGVDQGLSGFEALAWGMENVKFHQPTLDTVQQLAHQVFRDETPELCLEGVLDAMTQLSHLIFIEQCNEDMYGAK